MDEIDIPNHPEAECPVCDLPCRELGKVLIERDALRERLGDCLDTLRLIEKVTRPDGVMADAAVNLLIRSCRWKAFADQASVTLGKAGVEEVRDRLMRAERALLAAGFQDRGAEDWAPPVSHEAGKANRRWLEAEAERDALRVEAEELRHRANGWADIATSGLQWLRNVRDGLSTPQTAIENMESLIADLREGRWRAIPDPAIRAEDLVEALSDEPAAPQGEVQP